MNKQSESNNEGAQGFRAMFENLTGATWGRILLATVAVQVIVHGILTLPVLTLLMTVVAAAWVTKRASREAAARQGMVFGGVVALTSLVVTGWFGLLALLWCAQMVGAGWLGSRFSRRLNSYLPGASDKRPSWFPGTKTVATRPPANGNTPAPSAPTPSTWTYSPGVPGSSAPAWVYTPGSGTDPMQAPPVPPAPPTPSTPPAADPAGVVAEQVAPAPAPQTAPEETAPVPPAAPSESESVNGRF
jgi:hypothetical protein